MGRPGCVLEGKVALSEETERLLAELAAEKKKKRKKKIRGKG